MKNKVRETHADRVFNVISTIMIIGGCLLVLYPLYFILIASISDPKFVQSGQVFLWPRGITFSGFKRILAYDPLWIGYRNSLFYTVFGALFSASITLLAAYPMSRKDFSGRKSFSIFVLITMFFQGGLIPLYIIVNGLNLRNTFGVLILIGGVQVMNLFIASSYFRANNIEEMFEASQIDGCTHFGYFFKILLPVSSPIVIVMLLFYGVWRWNDFFNAMIYLDKPKYFPIQLVLKDLLASSKVTGAIFEMMSEDQESFNELIKAAESMKYGIIIMATVPMLLLYLILQEYFVKGITMGSVKG